jgi:hypothetical protein
MRQTLSSVQTEREDERGGHKRKKIAATNQTRLALFLCEAIADDERTLRPPSLQMHHRSLHASRMGGGAAEVSIMSSARAEGQCTVPGFVFDL